MNQETAISIHDVLQRLLDLSEGGFVSESDILQEMYKVEGIIYQEGMKEVRES